MTIVEELAAVKAENLQMKTAAEESKTKLAAAEAARDAAVAASAEATQKVTALEAEKAAAIKAGADAMEAEKAVHATTKTELETARKALANPAFAAAAAVGAKAGTPEGSAEAKNDPAVTKENAQAIYNKIAGAQERADFRAKYAKELGLEK